MQVPTVPTFVAGDISLVKLQQLSNCVSFLTNAQNYPMWHAYSDVQIPIVGGTSNIVPFNATAIDTDHCVEANSSGVVLNTQGYYATEACVPILGNGLANGIEAWFQFTAGPFNPHYTNGTTINYGARSGLCPAVTNSDEVLSLDDLCPVVCYPADMISVICFPNSSCNIDSNNPASAVQGRFVTNFTGRWIRAGS